MPPAVCSVCNYDLSAIPPNEHNTIICPECGSSPHPFLHSTPLTRSALHKKLLKRLLLPTAIPSLVCVVMVFIYNTLPQSQQHGLPIVMTLFAATLAIALICAISIIPFWIAATMSALAYSRPFPRPFPRWTLPLIALLYAAPAIALYIALYIVLGYML
jgi:hypothetical protein